MQIAHELDPACQQHSEDLERVMCRIPLAVADTLEVQQCSAIDISQLVLHLFHLFISS